MSSLARIGAAAETDVSVPAVEIVVPVRDESRVLAASVRRLHRYLTDGFGGAARGAGTSAQSRPLGVGRPTGATGLGGLVDASTPAAALVSLLKEKASTYTWVAATVGANSAAGVELATGDPILAIGGFNGTDPTPTLVQFEVYVVAGKIHYFLADSRGRGGGGFGGSVSSSEIASWVEAHFTATTVGGVTVYDLTAPRS